MQLYIVRSIRGLVMNFRIFSSILLFSIPILVFQNCSEVQFQELRTASQEEPVQIFGNDDGIDLGDGTCVSDCESGDPFDPENPNIDIFPYTGSEWASIAFEDNILSPNGGDLDYNDAVINFKISEEYNALGELIKIHIRLKKRVKISGNDHRLHLFLNGNPTGHFDNIAQTSSEAFVGGADVHVTLADGEQVSSTKDSKITLIHSSSNIPKSSIVKVEIELHSPKLNKKNQRQSVNFTKYRFILQNKSSGQSRVGIDISEINRSDEMITPRGHPFGFMIPTDWQAPREGQLIDNAYPKFKYYRQWLLNGAQPAQATQEVKYWFL